MPDFTRVLHTFVAAHADPRGILDAGCGIGDYLPLLSGFGVPVTGVDAHAPYLSVATPKAPTATLHCGVLPQWLADKADRCWSVVVCTDVLEHLDRDAGRLLLTEMRRTADAVLVFTPDGFVPQDTDAWGMGGEVWQTHQTGWTRATLAAAGFDAETWPNHHATLGFGALVARWQRA